MRALFALLTLSCLLFAMPDDYWKFKDKFDLVQDQFVTYEINKKIFFMRWSLFHNKGLVVNAKFDHFPYQYILYNDYKLNSFKIPVLVTDRSIPLDPHIVVVFDGFADNKARFSIFLYDATGAVEIKKVE